MTLIQGGVNSRDFLHKLTEEVQALEYTITGDATVDKAELHPDGKIVVEADFPNSSDQVDVEIPHELDVLDALALCNNTIASGTVELQNGGSSMVTLDANTADAIARAGSLANRAFNKGGTLNLVPSQGTEDAVIVAFIELP